MPPGPSPALPGAPAPPPDPHYRTHSEKFPIEREVILCSDKGAAGPKVPALADLRRRRAPAVAPDAPPKQSAAWTMQAQQQSQPSTSNETSFRQYYHEQSYGNYGVQNNNALSRSFQNLEQNSNASPKPPIPAKNISLYSKGDMKTDILNANNSKSITVTVETTKDSTKDAPKSNSKSVSKTYHTLKDMISSRFKSKDNSELEKCNENDTGLNNATEDVRKSLREKSESEATTSTPKENTTPRENLPRKAVEQNIYGRPLTQPRSGAEMQYTHQMIQQMTQNGLPSPNNMQMHLPSHSQYPQHQSPKQQHQMLSMQQQLFHQQLNQHQQMFLNQQLSLGHGLNATSTPQNSLLQARSQEMLARPSSQILFNDTPQRPHSQMMPHSVMSPDSVYCHPQYGASNMSGVQRIASRSPAETHKVANFTSLRQTDAQMDYNRSQEVRSPQQIEREILRQRGLAESRRTASQPQLPLEEARADIRIDDRPGPIERLAKNLAAARRSSHGNLLDAVEHARDDSQRCSEPEKDSDDGGFRARLKAQGRSSFDNRDRPQHRSRGQKPDGDNIGRGTPDNCEVLSQKSSEDGNKSEDNPVSRAPPTRSEPLPSTSKTVGSAASSDCDKNHSSNVDSGRGSAAYSSGRTPDTENTKLTAKPSTSKATHSQGESEWVDIVESELRQILEPRLRDLELSCDGAAESSGSATPPLPPLSPGASTPPRQRNQTRYKHQSLPATARYNEEARGDGRWNGHKPRSRRPEHHSRPQIHYKKHLFGLDTTDMTSTTTRSLDLSSMLGGATDSEASAQDARAIRRQLQGLEAMYCEVLKLLGVRKPAHAAPAYQTTEPRLSKRRYGSMSSLPSSSVSSRPRRMRAEHAPRNTKTDYKGINKRFQRLESHVVTLARSVAQLSGEMRTQHLVLQELESIRQEMATLRSFYRSQGGKGAVKGTDPASLGNPHRVKKLTKFFGDEPPLMRQFLKRLGYEKYAPILEAERVGAAELPYVGEERLRSLGVPLGPRLRILKEAGLATHLPAPVRDAAGNTTTTLAIV